VNDVDRSALTADVAKKLVEPGFAKLLSAVAPDGTTPVIPALRSDVLEDILKDVQAAGGAGNIVVPVMNGYLVIALKFVNSRKAADHDAATLAAKMTIGVLIARIMEDGGKGATLTYRIAIEGRKEARADLAGLAVAA